jgi:serine phosphatase RsbU (regulator of sigma subunit)
VVPISAKLIVTTSVVVAVAVGVATWFSQQTIDDLTAKQIDTRRVEGEKAIATQSEYLAKSVANAVASPLANNMLGADLALPLEQAMRDDHASGDDRVQWLVVTDEAGTIDARAGNAPTEVGTLDKLLAVEKPSGGVTHARVGASSDWVYRTPIRIGERQVGMLRMGVTTAGLEAELRKTLVAAEDRAAASRKRVWLIALGVLGIGVLAAALQGVSLARPVKVLTRQAERIAAGDLKTRVPEGRGDELGVLARTFNFMSDAMVQLLAAQAQKVSLEKEMELARAVQQAMIPPDRLDEHGAFKVCGYCMPASQCGGDWWMYRKLQNGRMLLVIGDATGHGIHSAMIAACARGAVEALAAVDEKLLVPDQVLRAIDHAIRMVGDHNVLMTAFAAVFDSDRGTLHYANAGQNFPYVMKLNAGRVLEQASIIAASGNPLGDRHIAVEIRRGSLQLTPGDLFVCFTDGLVERSNPAGKLFGDRRLRSALTGQALPDGNSLVAVRDKVLAANEKHAEGSPADDDITFVLCQFDPARTSQNRVA